MVWLTIHNSILTENVNIHAKVIPKIETREGQEYVRIEKVKIRFTPTK